MSKTIEYRVRPVTRFIVTRYERSGKSSSSEVVGEFENANLADRVARAMGGADHGADIFTSNVESVKGGRDV